MSYGKKVVAVLGLLVAFWVSLGAIEMSRRRGDRYLSELAPLPVFQLPSVTTASEGTVSLESLKGRPWVAAFVFTRCGGPCPMISMRMAALDKVLPKDLPLVTFTVDPDYDRLPILKEYAVGLNASPRWSFARAEKGELFKLMNEGFRLPLAENADAPPTARVTHSTRLVLVGPDARIRGFFDGLDNNVVSQVEGALRRIN